MDIELLYRIRPHVTLAHHLPGRLRLRAAMSLATSGLAGALDGLRATPGIGRVAVSPVTGSVLVEYEPTLLPPALVQGLFEARSGEEFRRLVLALWPGDGPESAAPW